MNLNSILIYSEHPKELQAFYEKIFGVTAGWSEGDFKGYRFGTVDVMIGLHDKVKGANMTPERLILNFETNDVRGEFERIKNLGATVIAEPYHPMEASDTWIATFSDVDGNYFQLASPMKI
jgi:predicted enzyme related to lactoylglutathione lyase